MARPTLSNVNVGTNIGKTQLDVCIHESPRFVSFGNNAKGNRQLVLLLDMFPVERIVIEATGGLEQPFVEAAPARGLPVVVMQPIKIRRFAGAIGLLAKTEELDAGVDRRVRSSRETAVAVPGEQKYTPYP